MTTLKQTENGYNEALPYNSKHGFENGEVKTFTDQTYEDAPGDYENHPYQDASSGGTAAGAYQILNPTYNLYKKSCPDEIKDFSPESQDRLVISIFLETKSYKNIKAGDIAGAVKKLTKKPVQFASLPGGGQTTKKIKDVETLFKKNFTSELNGKTNISLPKNGETQ